MRHLLSNLFYCRVAPAVFLIASLALVGCAQTNTVRQPNATNQPTINNDSQARLVATAEEISVEFRRWLSLAEQNDVNAQFHLGTLYDQGMGVGTSPGKAMEWFSAAALQGSPDAQLYLGLMYSNGRGVSKDDAMAALWFRKAAEQGFEEAQYQLGLAYAGGIGVPQDDKQGFFWLHKAADQGNASAQHHLGLCYVNGDGVEKDLDKASEWIFRAVIGYMEEGRIKIAEAALHDIEQQLPGRHIQTTQLRARLALVEVPPSARQPDFAWTGVSIGTGWPIAPGYVVTNNHVIDGSDEIVLINPDGERMAASIALRDDAHDLAVLAVKDTKQLPLALPLARQSAPIGASVFTVGFPRIDLLGKTPKLSAGLVSAVNGFDGDASTYRLELLLRRGNSGGPLVNMNGEVVGIVVSMLGAIDANGNIHPIPTTSYSVKAIYLQDLLSSLPIRDPEFSELPHYTDTVDGLADRIQQSVLMVVAK
jgi:hypothetical protein